MLGRPAVTGAQLCIPIPESHHHARLLRRAPYQPEPGMANLLTCPQLIRLAGLMWPKVIGNSCQTVTNWVPLCQRQPTPIFGYQGPVITLDPLYGLPAGVPKIGLAHGYPQNPDFAPFLTRFLRVAANRYSGSRAAPRKKPDRPQPRARPSSRTADCRHR